MEIKHHVTEQLMCIEEIKGKIKNYGETNENRNTTYQTFTGYRKSGSKREGHSSTGLPQKTRTFSSKRSDLTP